MRSMRKWRVSISPMTSQSRKWLADDHGNYDSQRNEHQGTMHASHNVQLSGNLQPSAILLTLCFLNLLVIAFGSCLSPAWSVVSQNVLQIPHAYAMNLHSDSEKSSSSLMWVVTEASSLIKFLVIAFGPWFGSWFGPSAMVEGISWDLAREAGPPVTMQTNVANTTNCVCIILFV